MSTLPDNRFEIELEFIQNLSNFKYLNYLAINKYFDDPTFIDFLKYLRYWKQAEYTKYLLFPQCLAILDALIDNPSFRRDLLYDHFINYAHAQQGNHWLYPYASDKSSDS